MVQWGDRPVHKGRYNVMTGRSIWDGTTVRPAGRYGMVQPYDRPVDMGRYNLTTGRSIWYGTTI
jgi:hypothetical protein